MTHAPAGVVAVPLLAAAHARRSAGKWLPDRARGVSGVRGRSGAASCCAAILLVRDGDRCSSTGSAAGGRARAAIPLGIAFVADRIGVGFALLRARRCSTAALVYSWRYIEDEHYLFIVLMLAFGAAMVGFALTGDIFNMFVFFELMSVAAFALTAYKVEEPSPLQGAFNFAVSNTIGAFLVLFGIALLYGAHRARSTSPRSAARSRRRPARRPRRRRVHADHLRASSSRRRWCRSTSGSPTPTRPRRRPCASSSPA